MEQNVIESPNWKDLPPKVFICILNQSSLKYLVQCCLVCKSWQKTVSAVFKDLTEFTSIGKDFTDIDAEVMHRKLPRLKTLTITLLKAKNLRLTRAGVEIFWKLRELESFEIDFAGRKFINTAWFTLSMRSFIFGWSLKILKIANVTVDKDFLDVLVDNSPRLEILTLESIRNLCNLSRGIQNMASKLRYLVSLYLTDLASIEDLEVNKYIVNPIPSFNKLYRIKVSDVDFPNAFFKLFKAPTLKILHLYFCTTLCDEDIEQLVRRCPNITHIFFNVAHDCQLNDHAVEIFSLFLKDLREFRLDGYGTTISYHSVRFMLKNVEHLRVVIFRNLESFDGYDEVQSFLKEASTLRYPRMKFGE